MSEDIIIEEINSTRFGHTITSLDHPKIENEKRIIMFGGAIGCLNFTITNDIYILNRRKITFKKMQVTSKEEFPSPRASHAAVAINSNQMVIFGGARTMGKLVDNGVYLLSIDNKKCSSQKLKIQSKQPSSRYGHTLTYLDPYLVLFGGSKGKVLSDGLWIMHMGRDSYMWDRLKINLPSPSPRVYHSAVNWQKHNQHFIFFFGGKTGKVKTSNELWVLRRDEQNSWDWFPLLEDQNETSIKPSRRAQHSMFCLKDLIIITGGKDEENKCIKTDLFDIKYNRWIQIPDLDRYKHECFMIKHIMYYHGGLTVSNTSPPVQTITKFNLYDNLKKHTQLLKNLDLIKVVQTEIIQIETDEMENKLYSDKSKKFRFSNTLLSGRIRKGLISRETINELPFEGGNESHPESSRSTPLEIEEEGLSVIQIAHNIVNELLLPMGWENKNFKEIKFRKTHIEMLCDEVQNTLALESSLLHIRPGVKIFGSLNGQFKQLLHLFNQFGIPSKFHKRTKNTDIEAVGYLFLGNYIDLGPDSINILLLLFSLKVIFPEQINLLRGKHECKSLNISKGFGKECNIRFNENIFDNKSIFNKFNKVFNYLPFAAKIGYDILCVPSGIGNSLFRIDQIEKIERPFIYDPIFVYSEEQKLVNDLINSNPVCTFVYDKTRVHNSDFDEVVLDKFKRKNGISIIITSNHQFGTGSFEFKNTNFFNIWSNFNALGKNVNDVVIAHHKKYNNTLEFKRVDRMQSNLVYLSEDCNKIITEDSSKSESSNSPLSGSNSSYNINY